MIKNIIIEVNVPFFFNLGYYLKKQICQFHGGIGLIKETNKKRNGGGK